MAPWLRPYAVGYRLPWSWPPFRPPDSACPCLVPGCIGCAGQPSRHSPWRRGRSPFAGPSRRRSPAPSARSAACLSRAWTSSLGTRCCWAATASFGPRGCDTRRSLEGIGKLVGRRSQVEHSQSHKFAEPPSGKLMKTIVVVRIKLLNRNSVEPYLASRTAAWSLRPCGPHTSVLLTSGECGQSAVAWDGVVNPVAADASGAHVLGAPDPQRRSVQEGNA